MNVALLFGTVCALVKGADGGLAGADKDPQRVHGMVCSEDGKPIPFVEIADDRLPMSFYWRTDENGAFDLPRLPLTTEWTFDTSGYCQTRQQMTSGGLVRVTMRRCADIEVVVQDSRGRPLHTPGLKVQGGDAVTSATMVAQGEDWQMVLGLGIGVLQVAIEGRPDIVVPAIPLRQLTRSRVVVKSGGSSTLTVRVVDQAGTDVTGFVKTVAVEGTVPPGMSISVGDPRVIEPTKAERGRFEGLKQGSYTLVDWSTTGVRSTATVVVKGARTRATFKLPYVHRELP